MGLEGTIGAVFSGSATFSCKEEAPCIGDEGWLADSAGFLLGGGGGGVDPDLEIVGVMTEIEPKLVGSELAGDALGVCLTMFGTWIAFCILTGVKPGTSIFLVSCAL